MIGYNKYGQPITMRFNRKDCMSLGARPQEIVCPMCGETTTEVTKDHFWPRAMGGVKVFGKWYNVWWVCRTCNLTKKHSLPCFKTTVAFSRNKGFCDL